MFAYYHEVLDLPMDESFMEQRAEELASCQESGAEEYRRVVSSVLSDHPDILGPADSTTVATVARPKEDDPYLSTGVADADAVGILVATSVTDYLYFIAFAIDDVGEILEMLGDRRLVQVSAGTPVQVLDEAERWSVVEILTGPEAGVTGWVHPEWVVVPGQTAVTSVLSRSTTTRPPSATTTTTASVSLPLEPGPPALRLDGLGVAYFGQPEVESVEALELAFGQPEEDSGWVDAFSPWGSCPGESVRRLRWIGLEAFLLMNASGVGPIAAGTPAFAAYIHEAGPLHLATPEGIGPGSSQSQLQATYGPRLNVSPAEWLGDDYMYFLVNPPAGWPAWAMMSGYLNGGEVESILAGLVCGE